MNVGASRDGLCCILTFLAIASPLCYKVSGGHDTEAGGGELSRGITEEEEGEEAWPVDTSGDSAPAPPETGSHDRRHVWERLEEARMLHVRMQGSWENANIRAHKLSRTGR